MSTIGNILWIICGGLLESICWCIAGIICYITVIGIPLGAQCFKFAKLSLAPFGKEIIYGGGAISLIFNILWLLCIGIWQALVNCAAGIFFCMTIIGIPFGLQFFKLAKLWLMPFGSRVTG